MTTGTTNGSGKPVESNQNGGSKVLETREEKKERTVSLIIVYFVCVAFLPQRVISVNLSNSLSIDVVPAIVGFGNCHAGALALFHEGKIEISRRNTLS